MCGVGSGSVGYETNHSHRNTTMQQMTDTGNRPSPRHAAMIPVTSANSPGSGDSVACVMAGNVMMASVT